MPNSREISVIPLTIVMVALLLWIANREADKLGQQPVTRHFSAINDVKTKKITFFGYLLPLVQQSNKKIGREGAEFLAMILVIVYVGAVAVLFLFVVMMLDINFSELRAGFLQYLPIGAIVGIILLAELILVFVTGAIDIHVPDVLAVATPAAEEVSNTRALGNILYTRYAYLFQGAGFILLVAMVGAIVLARRES